MAVLLTFLIPEFLFYISFVLCIVHACLKYDKSDHATSRSVVQLSIVRLFFGLVFGVVLEILNGPVMHGYNYNDRFLVMLFDVPLCIGVAWGCIIYSYMHLSDLINAPAICRPCMDAIGALLLDLSMDAVAIRITPGFWNWTEPGFWWGVPMGNFHGWLWVVFYGSGFFRLHKQFIWPRTMKLHWALSLLLDFVFGALIATVSVTLLCITLTSLWTLKDVKPDFAIQTDPIIYLIVAGLIIVVFAIVAVVGIVIGLKKRSPPIEKVDYTDTTTPLRCPQIKLNVGLGRTLLIGLPYFKLVDSLTWGVSLTIHIYFASALFWAGVYRVSYWLILTTFTMMFLSLVYHIVALGSIQVTKPQVPFKANENEQTTESSAV